MTGGSAQELRRSAQKRRWKPDFLGKASRLAKEHEIRFSKLHEKRAEVISEVYALLKEANDSTVLLDFALELGPLAGEEERFKEERAEELRKKVADETTDKCSRLASSFSRHKLYFSEELSGRMESLITALSKPSSSYRLLPLLVAGDTQEARLRILDSLRNERPNIQHILALLEKDFRILLGSGGE